ncbi:MAG: GatB/YqeY domain-containing protein [Candidatus Omnitrophica bacterium]|nr:GatB/YqeY domain-containing protein [Candidatus Omnitrophota bacterium]
MPTLTDRIEDDYKTAMKAGDRIRIDTLRLIKAGIQKVAIDKRKDRLDDPEILQVLSQQAKQRRETIESAKQSNRQDILTQSEQELALLNSYLPQQLSEEALRKLIDDAIATVGKQQGPIMKDVMAKASGAADGKLVSRLVAERLSKG